MDKYIKAKPFLLDLFFPKFCLGCQTEGVYLCQDCRSLLEILELDYCLCEKDPVIILPNTTNKKCHRCRDKSLSGLYFAISYKNKLTQRLIKSFKYPPYLKDLAKTLASILIEHFILSKNNTDQVWENAILIPVPLSIKKLKERGYNQSEELAKELSVILNVPVVSDVLVKTKHTDSQMELKKEEREKNLLGAFEIKNPEKIQGKKIFLVDDVYTTGSTMEQCAKVLKTADAKSIFGITLAREEY